MFAHIFDKKNQIDPDISFKKKSLLTDDEFAFFQNLQKILPHRLIFPQLSLSSLAHVNSQNDKQRSLAEQHLNYQKVDFSIYDRDLELLCLIELTSTNDHHLKDQLSFQVVTEKAGIPSIQWDKNNLPTADQMLRCLAPYSNLTAPKAEPTLAQPLENNFHHLRSVASSPTINVNVLPEHQNPDALSLKFLRDLTPDNYIQREYPHIWQRICLFAGEPEHLKNYLESLFLQNRPVKRFGLPQRVADEVIVIQTENRRFIENEEENNWHDDLVKDEK